MEKKKAIEKFLRTMMLIIMSVVICLGITKSAYAKVSDSTKTAAKKAPAKKTTAKKAEVKTEMFLQFAGKEYTEKEIFQKVKDVWTKVLKNKVGDLKDVKIYLKPEDSAAYYVINGDTTGRVEL